MQCPRCYEEIADNSTACPVCLKPIPTGVHAANVRIALTGEVCEAPQFASTVPESAYPPLQAPSAVDAADAPVILPSQITFTNPGRSAVRQPTASVLRPPRQRQGRLWSIVILAIAGALAGGMLWYRPYVPPVDIAIPNPGGDFITNERAIPAVYLWLWGGYAVLAVATQFFLPAPWRIGSTPLRNNWVLNITTVLTILLFLGTGFAQQGQDLIERDGIYYQEDGSYRYVQGNETRTITAEEAQRIHARIIRQQDAATFRIWSMAALLSYLALGGYAAWWLIVRPEGKAPLPIHDAESWLRWIRGEHAPTMAQSTPETPIRLEAQSREPVDGGVSWR